MARCIHDWIVNQLDPRFRECPLCGTVQMRRWFRWKDWLPPDDEHNHACCPPDDCCGGPCAAHPCWELTT